MPNPLPRLLEKSVLQGDCLVYQGAVTNGGYGRIKVNGKTVVAHRVMWEEMNGPIPDGLILLHSCDNPPCVLPAHLRLGTHQDNKQDSVDKGRHYKGGRPQKPTCFRGHTKVKEKNRMACRVCNNERRRKK